MAGSSIVVDRRKKLGWAARLYLPSMLRGLRVTGRHFVRNLRALAKGEASGSFGPRYPEAPAELPEAFRGMPVLVAREDGSPRCDGCGDCATACPTSCIRVVASAGAGSQAAPPERFDLDMSRCIFCGYCEDACPEEAIVMSPLVELAADDLAGLQYDLEALLVPAELLSRRLAFLEHSSASREPSGGSAG
jgi:NADH-quinone oxidoreductase subunit I